MSDFNETDREFTNCPHCGEQILKKAIICKHCKKSVEMAECPFCAELNLKDVDVCAHCGGNLKKLVETVPAEKIGAKAPVNEKSEGFPVKRLMLFLIGLAVFFASFFAFVVFKVQDQWEINRMSEKCEKGDFQACDFIKYSFLCKEGSSDGCMQLGIIYCSGVIVKKDGAKGLRLLQKSCDIAGDQGRCFALETLKEMCLGQDVKVNESSSGNWSNKSPKTMNWSDAKKYCENLKEEGYSDWRLPTISELRTLIQNCPRTDTGGACKVTNDCLSSNCWSNACERCYPRSSYSKLGDTEGFWSSSELSDREDRAWNVGFGNGDVSNIYKNLNHYVRCVR
ncbi:MAG TPA: DUF1566 domain-containing protein [bacterium]|nr:DUF1566 domain-containing protein [bacterium]